MLACSRSEEATHTQSRVLALQKTQLAVFGFGFLHQCDLLGLGVYELVTFPLELRHEDDFKG